MESSTSARCPAHGAGSDPSMLVGTRLKRVVAARLILDDQSDRDPIDVWLVDDAGASIHLTCGSDWCLIVERAEPQAGYDMGALGRVEVSCGIATPFGSHIGEQVVAVRESWEPRTGRVGVHIEFESGGVRCESWAGDLRLRAATAPGRANA